MEERAYHLSAEKETLSFSVEAEDESPLVNPCFVIKNWSGQQKASLRINAKEMASGKQFRQGLVRDTQGKPMLVAWIEMQTTEPVTIALSASGKKAAQPLTREVAEVTQSPSRHRGTRWDFGQ